MVLVKYNGLTRQDQAMELAKLFSANKINSGRVQHLTNGIGGTACGTRYKSLTVDTTAEFCVRCMETRIYKNWLKLKKTEKSR